MTPEQRIRHDMSGEAYTDDEIEQTVERYYEDTHVEETEELT